MSEGRKKRGEEKENEIKAVNAMESKEFKKKKRMAAFFELQAKSFTLLFPQKIDHLFMYTCSTILSSLPSILPVPLFFMKE